MFWANWFESTAIVRDHPNVDTFIIQRIRNPSGPPTVGLVLKMAQYACVGKQEAECRVLRFRFGGSEPGRSTEKSWLMDFLLFVGRVNNRHNFDFSCAANQDGVAMKTARVRRESQLHDRQHSCA